MHLFTKFALPIAVVSRLAIWPLSSATLSQMSTSHRAAVSVVDEGPANPSPANQTQTIARLSDEELAKASITIDAIINADLEKLSLKALPKTKDDQFLRRVYLDLAGRIPTVEEAAAFYANKKGDKRDSLIKTVLGSQAHVHHMFTWWADLLRAGSTLQDKYTGAPYIDWIKNSIKANKPFDKMVYEMVTAEGPALARGNGATGFWVTDKGMPQDNMANTVRVFLGTRLACAQCHDHPFDKWTRKEFFEMVAFTEGVETQTGNKEYKNALKGVGGKNPPANLNNIANDFGEKIGLKVTAGSNGGMTALPKDYQYKDGRPGEKIKALTMFEDDILKGEKSSTARDTYAKWMTSPENPRFALVVANRIWKKLMKVGFIEPVDDFTDETVSKNKELADYLTKLMVSVKFDLRKFQEIVASTEAYQRQAITEDEDKMDFHYHGMPLQRLSAEQVWDSLMTLTVANVDSLKGEGAEPDYKFYDEYKNKTTEQIAEVILKMSQSSERLGEIKKELKELKGQTKGGKEAASQQAKIESLMKEQEKLMAAGNDKKRNRYTGLGPLRRASELSSPTPPSHFLRVFGQSDRFVIENSTDSLNLTQSLDLMNGMVETTILGDEKSVLSQQLAKVKSPSDTIQVIYFAVLSRMPTSSEVSFGNRVMSLAPNKRGAEYLSWALINSAEFMFNQ